MSGAATTLPKIRIFGGAPTEIRYVRDFVRHAVHGRPVADDVVLLASEVATNAIRHTTSGGEGTFSVCVYIRDGKVRVEVNDLGSDMEPSVGSSDAVGESGAGLWIVEAIADRWGFYGGQLGRVVWFEMDCR